MSHSRMVDCEVQAPAFIINVGEHVSLYQMLVSYTVYCCAQVSICSVADLPAGAMAIQAKHGLNESGRSAQGTYLWALLV